VPGSFGVRVLVCLSVCLRSFVGSITTRDTELNDVAGAFNLITQLGLLATLLLFIVFYCILFLFLAVLCKETLSKAHDIIV